MDSNSRERSPQHIGHSTDVGSPLAAKHVVITRPRHKENRMRRSLLTTITVLGALICLVGGTGLFAALTDTAKTGTNTVTSDDLATSIDIKLATADFSAGGTGCGSFVDDLTTPLFTQTDLHPGSGALAFFCLTNVGTRTAANLDVLSIELTDVDQACTGDEADSGDTTCGGDAAGELSDALAVIFVSLDCGTGSNELWSTGEVYLRDSTSTLLELPPLASGATLCLKGQVAHRFSADSAVAQMAQSDTASWRFRFSAGT
jgi:hypothetical protein